LAIDASLVKPVRQSQLLNTLATTWSKRLEAAPPLVGRPAPQLAERDSAPVPGFPSVRVLVADDNVVNQKVASLTLQRLGLRPDVAANGREAVEMFEMAPYDLIFMDCQMPEMDGYQASREIRRRERANSHVIIIAMTAEAMAGARESCLDAGMDDYIAKPVRRDDLFQLLVKWIPSEKTNVPHLAPVASQ
jgi:CheY-like chemotaxis protein